LKNQNNKKHAYSLGKFSQVKNFFKFISNVKQLIVSLQSKNAGKNFLKIEEKKKDEHRIALYLLWKLGIY